MFSNDRSHLLKFRDILKINYYYYNYSINIWIKKKNKKFIEKTME